MEVVPPTCPPHTHAPDGPFSESIANLDHLERAQCLFLIRWTPGMERTGLTWNQGRLEAWAGTGVPELQAFVNS